jgi:hypothetical protein
MSFSGKHLFPMPTWAQWLFAFFVSILFAAGSVFSIKSGMINEALSALMQNGSLIKIQSGRIVFLGMIAGIPFAIGGILCLISPWQMFQLPSTRNGWRWTVNRLGTYIVWGAIGYALICVLAGLLLQSSFMSIRGYELCFSHFNGTFTSEQTYVKAGASCPGKPNHGIVY